MLAIIRGHDRRAGGIDLMHPCVTVQGNAPRGQMAHQVAQDALGEQHTAAWAEQGKAGAREVEERQAPGKIPRRPAFERDPEIREAADRILDPAAVLAGDRQRAGRSIVAAPEISEQTVPGSMGILHHPRVAGHRAVGETDQTVLIGRGRERIGDRPLLVEHHLVACAIERPGGAQPHDPAAGDDHPQCFDPYLSGRARWRQQAAFRASTIG
jgi:hypothetical protein